MHSRIAALALVLWFAPSPSPAGQPERTMTVFVRLGEVITHSGEPSNVETEKYKAAITAAHTRRRDLDKALKAQHGSKRDRWPGDALRQLQEADDRVALAESDWTYRTLTRDPKRPASPADSVDDIRESLSGKGLATRREHVVVAQTYEAAQLVVEVDGRYRSGTLLDPVNNAYWVRIAIKRGPKLSEQQFAAVPFLHQFRNGVYPVVRLAAPGAESASWRFDVAGLLSFSAAGKGVASLVEEFVAKHYDVMMAAR
jgi:hypothetical protein